MCQLLQARAVPRPWLRSRGASAHSMAPWERARPRTSERLADGWSDVSEEEGGGEGISNQARIDCFSVMMEVSRVRRAQAMSPATVVRRTIGLRFCAPGRLVSQRGPGRARRSHRHTRERGGLITAELETISPHDYSGYVVTPSPVLTESLGS